MQMAFREKCSSNHGHIMCSSRTNRLHSDHVKATWRLKPAPVSLALFLFWQIKTFAKINQKLFLFSNVQCIWWVHKSIWNTSKVQRRILMQYCPKSNKAIFVGVKRASNAHRDIHVNIWLEHWASACTDEDILMVMAKTVQTECWW